MLARPSSHDGNSLMRPVPHYKIVDAFKITCEMLFVYSRPYEKKWDCALHTCFHIGNSIFHTIAKFRKRSIVLLWLPRIVYSTHWGSSQYAFQGKSWFTKIPQDSRHPWFMDGNCRSTLVIQEKGFVYRLICMFTSFSHSHQVYSHFCTKYVR